jgi:hypothetical protein
MIFFSFSQEGRDCFKLKNFSDKLFQFVSICFNLFQFVSICFNLFQFVSSKIMIFLVFMQYSLAL